ncbi:unnamed protein product, partial [Symbiodinium microadriaticum]
MENQHRQHSIASCVSVPGMSSIDKLRLKKLQRQAQGASSDLQASLGAQPGA